MELQLNSPWTFYYFQKPTAEQGDIPYEQCLHKIGKFETAEQFWQIYSHMQRPHNLPNTITLNLFRNDTRPMWEDEANRKGGSFLVRLQKNQVKSSWERLVLNLIGEQFPEDVVGIAVSTRARADLFYFWHQHAADANIRLDIAQTITKLLELPIKFKIDYNPFDPDSVGLDPKMYIQYIVDANGPIEKFSPKFTKPEHTAPASN
ncbi:Eukaryotic initiation factor 4E family protein [Trichomonas vaginalis G3]|uniref:Eukaryotic initiation factor 4E family protein n=1 Tax=Trichomonas vaginalis (strain ATCC PRA-98 / G3) TaxID=412133 RepID=A2DLZ0_TRIV3|nr:translation initiation factor protein [Trichomonas vaginalis G3]EAY18593.1 Eukaryotic initiation factor 4E family protein [Trichomonas vaginalis G3]KAI5491621.1 translation initiation factor protein [Trichomonas vaginalis G3]|eukprot:XP_001579579.1 Eukaryotic initiation factor 4E family protein [Trichomonas vaginalis G3]